MIRQGGRRRLLLCGSNRALTDCWEWLDDLSRRVPGLEVSFVGCLDRCGLCERVPYAIAQVMGEAGPISEELIHGSTEAGFREAIEGWLF